MIIKPRIRGTICTTAHPIGCEESVRQNITDVKNYLKSSKKIGNALIIGSSMGYGLASRIVAAFGYGAKTIGVSLEKAPELKRTATPGWYNADSFEKSAKEENLYARNINGDAFSRAVKEEVAKTIKEDLGQIDLVVYSIAAGRRNVENMGTVSRTYVKPIGRPCSLKTIDLFRDKIVDINLPPATEEEINQTVSVMGGDDWRQWVEMLLEKNLLAQGFLTVAFSYVGPEITYPIYREGTMGEAKKHLENTAKDLSSQLKVVHGKSYVSVNKAVLTSALSAVTPIALYLAILMKVMKEKGCYENCIQQMIRLFEGRLYAGQPMPMDERGRIRMDDGELRDDVQKEVHSRWERINDANLSEMADLDGYRQEFLNLYGFGLMGVDYDKEC